MEFNDELLLTKYGHLLSSLTDSHCHVSLTQEDEKLRELLSRVGGLFVMGTHPDLDWVHDYKNKLIDEAISSQKLVVGMGIHPWFADKPIASGQDPIHLLQQHCAKYQLIGEIGLDKVSKNLETKQKHPFGIQLNLFKNQFSYSCSRSLSVSIHCVKAFGHLHEYFTKQLSVEQKKMCGNISLHSFNGSPETLRQFLGIKGLNRKLFFGVSYFVNARQEPKIWQERIKTIPDDRILIESDLDEMSQVPVALLRAAWMVSVSKNWSMEQVARITTRNALEFLQSNTVENVAN